MSCRWLGVVLVVARVAGRETWSYSIAVVDRREMSTNLPSLISVRRAGSTLRAGVKAGGVGPGVLLMAGVEMAGAVALVPGRVMLWALERWARVVVRSRWSSSPPLAVEVPVAPGPLVGISGGGGADRLSGVELGRGGAGVVVLGLGVATSGPGGVGVLSFPTSWFTASTKAGMAARPARSAGLVLVEVVGLGVVVGGWGSGEALTGVMVGCAERRPALPLVPVEVG